MEQHQDIARGYTKGDRVVVEEHWLSLAKNLNSSGPPTKDASGWKKTWADWKTYVKKKMCHNKKENQKTGGGEYNKYVLTDVEETMARICGFHKSVDGIGGTKSFAQFDETLNLTDCDNDEIDLTPSISKWQNVTSNLSFKTQASGQIAKYNSNLAIPSSPSEKSSPIRTTTPKCFERSTTQSQIDLTTPPTSTRKDFDSKTSLKRPASVLQSSAQKVANKNLNPTEESSPIYIKTPETAKKRFKRQITLKNDVNALLVEENKHLKSLVNIMENKLTEEKRMANLMLEQNQKLDRMCNILEKYVEAKLATL